MIKNHHHRAKVQHMDNWVDHCLWKNDMNYMLSDHHYYSKDHIQHNYSCRVSRNYLTMQIIKGRNCN